MTKTISRSLWCPTVIALTLLLAQAGHGDETLARQAFGADEKAAQAAISELRSDGPAGVEALLAVAPGLDAESRPRWERALDAVCAQRDCAASGLFWHTDLLAAQAEAERSGRAILSLRLLGRLDEEVSCANSRFFRTILYPDPEIGDLLKERFVLHWESVRPVPRVRIDFGDGRTLAGTVTGNSIHYVLDGRGRLVDALPGLYGPGLFLRALRGAEAAARELGGLDDEEYLKSLHELHLEAMLASQLQLAREDGAPAAPALARAAGRGAPTARQAERVTVTKAVTEMPLVDALSLDVVRGFEREAFDWAPLAERHRADWTLSPESRNLVMRKHLAATGAADPRILAQLERLVGLDAVRNEYLLRAVIHSWLASPLAAVPDLAAFNDRVYSELFLTPGSDPWLGLMSPETYLALAPVASEEVIAR